jgi:predicted TIM-barrel fold metal-dependent hydrolase
MSTHPTTLPVRTLLLLLVALFPALSACAQENTAPPPAMTFEEYDPRSTLVVPEHPVQRARYPFIDVHNHQWRGGTMDKAQLDTLVMQMDALNMAVMVNLSGGSKDRLQAMVGNMKGHHPHRFVVFANVDFAGIGQPDWTTRTVAQLKADVRNGAQGLKVWKNLGMEVRDTAGRRVPIDDPRLDPIWSTCGELGIPVLIHSADPRSFWEPHDRHNERWLEMKQFPERNHARDSTSWEQLIGEQHNLFRKHPRTIFINAHLGWYGHDLGALGRLMDEMPNMYTELGAVIYELGRQPRFAREWLIRYQDRVLMGKDIWEPSEYHVYFRVLETADEYFDYYRKRHAFWKMYGLDLPDAVLKKLYYQNALRIIPGIDRSAFPE